MASIGFTYYDTVPSVPQPTLQELIEALSGAQKIAILNGFTKKTLAKQLAYTTPGLDRAVIQRLYQSMDSMEELSRSLMRGEVLVTPAVIDPQTGEVTTPAVYNTPPASSGALLSAVQDAYVDIFTGAQVNAILTRMVEYSKWDGTGDWTFYSTQVKL